MAHPKQKILFLCTGNSARSIFAEYLTNKIGRGRFEAYSAGSQPSGKVNPFTLKVLKDQYKIGAEEAHSKSWNEFRDTKFDIIITVCDRAKESCPVFPGNAQRIHWSLEDPVAAEGTDEEQLNVFRKVRDTIQKRVKFFTRDFSK